MERFLPLLESEFSEQTEETLSAGATSSSSSAPAEDGVSRSADLFLMRPEPKELLRRLIEKHFNIQNYRIFLESQASEHGARMAAMENATKNAGEMIQKLTLQFNKQRQANITKELLEIIAGSESQKI